MKPIFTPNPVKGDGRMKGTDELVLPDDFRYAKDHEWARSEGDLIRCGISDYAQDQMGDIVFVELPGVGEVFSRGEQFGTVESVKAVVELYMPLGGEVVAVNGELAASPGLVNAHPYGEGWIIQIKPADPGEMDLLMGKDGYLEMLRGME
jgi:glycine cleavage system H protein